MNNYNKPGDMSGIKGPIVFTTILIILIVVLIRGVEHYKIKTLNIAYENNIAQIQNAITTMDAVWADYFHSPLYSDETTPNYNVKPGKFFTEHLSIKRYCGVSNGECFAKVYKREDGKVYKPVYEGACAVLKTGAVLCMKPQIRKGDIAGIIDVNGTDKPNMLGKDLKTFTIKGRIRNYDPEDDVAGEEKVTAF